MAAPLRLRGIPFLRLRLHHHHHHRIFASLFATPRCPWCTAAAPTGSDKNLSPTDNATADWSSADPRKNHWYDDTDYRKWKVEILRDIEPITYLAKDILHSDRSLSLSACPQVRPKTWKRNPFCYCAWLLRKCRKIDESKTIPRVQVSDVITVEYP